MNKGKITNLAMITDSQKQIWGKGDFNEIARQNVVMAEDLVKAVDPHPGQKVLDLACGSGTAALVAARRYCDVTGIDYVPEQRLFCGSCQVQPASTPAQRPNVIKARS